MKRSLSVLTALAILCSAVFGLSFVSSALPTAAGDQWILDFGAGQAAIDQSVFLDTSLKTTATYLPEEDAAVFASTQDVYTADARTPGFILGGTVTSNNTKSLAVKNSNVSDYPIIAIRLKLSDAAVIVDRFDWTTDTYETEGSGMWRSMSEAPAKLLATTEWQTVIIDTRKDTNGTTLSKLNGCWSGFRFFFKTPAGTQQSPSVSVAWIGVFADEAAAVAYNETRQATLEDTWSVDFTRGMSALGNVFVTNSAAKAFSAEENAAVFSSTKSGLEVAERTPSLIFGYGATGTDTDSVRNCNANVTRLTVMAVRLKLSDPDITFDQVNWSVNSTWRNVSGPNAGLAETTEWQTVYIDLSAVTNKEDFLPTNYYNGFRLLFLSPAGKSECANIAIEWIRLFECEEDARAYSDARIKEQQENTAVLLECDREEVCADSILPVDWRTGVSYDYLQSLTRFTCTGEASNRTPAVYVGTNRDGSFDYGLGVSAPVTEYPVIAIRLRLSNAQLAFAPGGRLDWTTTTYATSGEGTPWHDMKANITLAETTEWQTVVIDTRTLTNGNDTKWLSGDWAGLRIMFDGNTATEGDYVELKWIGFFKNISAVSAQEEVNHIYGDANDDGKLDLIDLIRVKKYVSEQEVTVKVDMADLNGDTKVDAIDLAAIRRRLLLG